MATVDGAWVKAQVTERATELFEPYARNRPVNWIVDSRTRELVCLGNWLQEHLSLTGVSDDNRRVTLWSFNRRSRSMPDLFQLTADVVNEVAAGTIDNKPAHRRWG